VVRSLVAQHARHGGRSSVLLAKGHTEWHGGEVVEVDFGAVSPDRDWDKRERAVDALLGGDGRRRRYAPRMYEPVAQALADLKPDVILLHEGHFATTAVPLVSAAASSSAVFLYLHNGVSRSIRRPELRALLASAQGVIAVSDYMADGLERRLGESGPPISVVPNGVDLDIFQPPVDRPQNVPPQVVFAGRLGPDKGVDLLVKACVRLHQRGVDHRLTVVGRPLHSDTSLSPYEQHLRGLAAPLERLVEFLPFLPPRELAAIFGAADVVCVPSVHPEPFGLVAAEAMACGACVVASDRGALPGVVADAGVVVRPEPDDLAAALESVLTQEATRQRLGRAGVRRAAEFSWGRSYRRLLAAIGERNDT